MVFVGFEAGVPLPQKWLANARGVDPYATVVDDGVIDFEFDIKNWKQTGEFNVAPENNKNCLLSIKIKPEGLLRGF